MTQHAITYQDRLRRARLDAGLGVRELSRLTGISASTISAVERGVRDLTAPKLFLWAGACGAALDWVAGVGVFGYASAVAVDEHLEPLELFAEVDA